MVESEEYKNNKEFYDRAAHAAEHIRAWHQATNLSKVELAEALVFVLCADTNQTRIEIDLLLDWYWDIAAPARAKAH